MFPKSNANKADAFLKSEPLKRVAVYVVLNPDKVDNLPLIVAKLIIVQTSYFGGLRIVFNDYTYPKTRQYKFIQGKHYNHLNAAMSGITFRGVPFGLFWQADLKALGFLVERVL